MITTPAVTHVTRIVRVDFMLHDEAHPFCDQEDCPCHDDKALYERCVAIPLFEDGTLTIAEALRLFEGRQV